MATYERFANITGFFMPVRRIHIAVSVREHVCKIKKKMPYTYLSRHLGLVDLDTEAKLAKMCKKIYTRYYYHQEFWTSIHQEMFGANRYHAFQLKLEYLKHHIIKPYDVIIRKAFQRIEVLLNYLPFYPPRTLVRDRHPTMADWSAFNDIKDITEDDKRDIQYSMLPVFYRDMINSWETDYETMEDSPRFLVRCEQIEVKYHKDPKERQDNKEKLKRKAGAAKEENSNANHNK